MTTLKMPVYEALSRGVADQGVDVVFGLMGDANLLFADHFARQPGQTFVPTAIEGSGVLAALAFGQGSEKIGVATVTQGPGLSNCFSALIEGVKRRAPMILIAGDTPPESNLSIQDLDQSRVVQATGAGFHPVEAPENAVEDLAMAFQRAQTEKRPIVLNVASHFMDVAINYAPPRRPVREQAKLVSEGAEFDAALGMLASARRPIILAGAGAMDARDELISLANRLEAPLATTLKAKDLFRHEAANMGLFGTLSSPLAYEAIANADCIAAFGASLNPFTTDQGRLLDGKRVIQISGDSADLRKCFNADAVLASDPARTAELFVHWLNEAEIEPSGFTAELNLENLAKHPMPQPSKQVSEGLPFVDALERLNRLLPENRILTTDGGRFMTEVWCRVEAEQPQRFLAGTDSGSIGLGLQSAIGLALAAPNQCVCHFSGDGGFMMGGLTEFNTAVRLNLPMVVVVCNDSAYGAEHIQLRDRGLDPRTTQFDWPSFAHMAEALGGAGVQVSDLSDWNEVEAALDRLDGPLLIELKLHPDAIPRMRI
jgi:thiamine pyrophosphate-dependent acetolactate synthase large subunit-like protein